MAKWGMLVGFPVFLVVTQLGLQRMDIPISKLARNLFVPATPAPIQGQHGVCDSVTLGQELTIVVTVKDACSQAPGFVKALEDIVPKSVHLIYTFPNFTSCSSIDMSEQLQWWDRVTMIPLRTRVSPMQGWLDAIAEITTPYSLLLHNDGYALDHFFACELLNGLKAKKKKDPSYVASAPMLYESKADGSLAAHATQSNLRLVPNAQDHRNADGAPSFTVRHDHSPARALNRGQDFDEGEQSEFLEDHGFLIETDKIAQVIDAYASYTLEYLDMIFAIRSHNWKVLFVPTARLEFRITEFSWRDLPYFMHKRSERVCHSTRDYLIAKWGVNFPNTGFWTYIKYTVVEQLKYNSDDLSSLPWKDQAATALAFFQMAGFNGYNLNYHGPADAAYGDSAESTPTALTEDSVIDFIGVLDQLDAGWMSTPGSTIGAIRATKRKIWHKDEIKTTNVDNLTEILPVGSMGFVNIEADMPLEYLPFATAEWIVEGSCAAGISDVLRPLCGLLIQHAERCSCWVNLPPFKSPGGWVSVVAQLAAFLKIPSRVSTYVEMFLNSGVKTTEYLSRLKRFENGVETGGMGSLRIMACNGGNAAPSLAENKPVVPEMDACTGSFTFAPNSRLLQFAGRPVSVNELDAALMAGK